MISFDDPIPADKVETPAKPQVEFDVPEQQPSFAEPVDVFAPGNEDLFAEWEKKQGSPDIGDQVLETAKHVTSGFWESTKELVRGALAPTRIYMNPQESPAEVVKKPVAFAAEVAAEAGKGFAVVGSYLKSAATSLSAKQASLVEGADSDVAKTANRAALIARQGFFRDLRDLNQSSNDGRVILDSVVNGAVSRINADFGKANTFSETPVNEEAARFVSNFVDPDMASVALRAGARGLGINIAKQVLERAPAEGLIAATQREVVAAMAKKAETETEVIAAKAAGADATSLEAKLAGEQAAVAEKVTQLKGHLSQLEAQQAAQLAELEAQGGKSLGQKILGKTVEGAGRAAQWGGEKAGAINSKLDEVLAHFSQGGGEKVVDSAASRAVPGNNFRYALEGALISAGRDVATAGRYIAAPESSLGYFQSLARALPEGSVGRWAASQAERFEFLATTGRWAMDTASDSARAAGVGAAFGAMSGDPVSGATQGAMFGMAGSQFGQFRMMNSPEQVYLQQRVDMNLSRKRRETAPGDQLKTYDEAPEGLRLAVATFEQAHPDLNIRLVRNGGKGGAGWYDFNGKVGEVTIDLDHKTPISGLLTHEVKHHLGRNPDIAQAIETKILGDPASGEAGIFTARDANGKPIVEETPDAGNPDNIRREFALTPEFYKFREEYLQQLRDAGLPTLEYERDNRAIAHEMWAESEAANLLNRQANGKFDVIATQNMGPAQRRVADLVSGSELVRNAPFVQKALAKFGVVFDGFSGRAANVGHFSKTLELAGLRETVDKYYRLRERERVVNEDPDQRDVRLYTDDEILKSPDLMDLFSSGHDVIRDPVSGKMRFVSEKEAKARADEFFKTLTAELDAYAGNEPGVVKKTTVVDANGRKSEVWMGTRVPESVVAKMEQSGRFNENQLKNLRTLSSQLQTARGNEINFFYQPAMKRGGKLYRTRPITERTETPMSIRITKDGNVAINTISQEKLQRNAVEAIKAGRAELWGNDYQALWSDVGLYLNNHANGLAGDANGLGTAKRDFINSLFGQFTIAQREANPFLQDLSERQARNTGVVQTRRLDRINKMFVLSTTFKPDYGKVSRNFSPRKKSTSAIEGSLGEGVLNLEHFSDQQGLTRLDPKFFGKSGVTPTSEMSGLPRSYAYVEGSKLGQDKGLIDKRTNRYITQVPKGKIYDGENDPLGYYQIINREKRDQMLIDRGFVGIYDNDGRKVVQLFKPVPVQAGGKKSGRFSPGARAAETPGARDTGNPTSRKVAEAYVKDAGLKTEPHRGYDELPEPQLRKIADYFENTAKHDPKNPAVAKSYKSLIDQTKAQYRAMLKAGVKIEPWTETKGEPYASSKEMMADVRDNNHLWFFLTDNGFGDGGAVNHPMLAKSGIKIGGRELLANDLFRAVHDYFGHTQQGFQFGPRGEFNAWKEHSRMFDEVAQGALAAETLAQNAWVNFGPHLRDAKGKIAGKGEPGYVGPKDRPFADQRAFVVPENLRQFSPGAKSGVFGSTETDSINFDRAVKNLDSEKHGAFKARARDLAPKADVFDVVGDWADGAENSVGVLFKDAKTLDDTRRLAAELGVAGNQKAMLHFISDESGPDSLHEVKFDGATLATARQALADAGIEFRSLKPGKGGVTAFIFDQGNQLADKLAALASHELSPQIESSPVRGEFLGSWNNRAEGLREYRRVLGKARQGGDQAKEGTVGGDSSGRSFSPGKVTETPEFKKWFGDSKVVDDFGQPAVMYHGTHSDFTKFRRRTGDVGMHFGPADQANERVSYLSRRPGSDSSGASVMPVFLSIKNPLRLPDLGAWNPENMKWKLLDMFPGDAARIGNRWSEDGINTTAKIREFLQSKGYDGIVYKNTGEVAGGEAWQEKIDAARKEVIADFGRSKASFSPADRERASYQKWVALERDYAKFREETGQDSWIAFDPRQIKSAIGNTGAFDSSNPDIRFSPGAVSSVSLRTGAEQIDLGPEPSVLDIGRALAARSRKAKRIPYDSRTEGAKDAAAEAMADEIAYAANQDRNAIGWYERKVGEAMDTLAQLHPEVKEDENVGSFYKAILAITSNGQSVVDNFMRAEQLYREWKDVGRIDTSSPWGGARSSQINGSLRLLQGMVDAHGLEATRQFLTRDFRFGDLKKVAKDLYNVDLGASEPVDHVIKGSAVFGPKVGGGFFPNLSGDFTPVTMDLWLMRTWNRINGSYGQSDQVAMGRALGDLRTAAAENPSHPDPAKISTMSDRQLGNWSADRYADWMNVRKFKNPDSFDRPAKRYVLAKEGAAEAPRNGSERAWVREIFKSIDTKLAERGLPPINNADKQALLWYYEKDLYTKLGYRNNRGQPADYADAARKVLETFRR